MTPPTFQTVTARPYLALDVIVSALAQGWGGEPPASARAIQAVELADGQIGNGGFSQLVFNFGIEALVVARDGVCVIGAAHAAEVFDAAIAIAMASPRALARYRAGNYFGDDAAVGQQLDALNEQYFGLDRRVGRCLVDYLLERDEPWYDAAVAAAIAAGKRLSLVPDEALRDAIREGHVGLVQRALAARRDPIPAETLPSAIGKCRARLPGWAEREEIVALLLDAGAPSMEPDPIVGETPLHVAARVSVATLGMLLARGAKPDPRDRHGLSPIHRAVDGAVVRALLAAGVDPRARSPDGVEPIHTVPSASAVEALLEAGASPDVRTAHGATPLHYLGQRPEAGAVARALLAAGADPRAVDAEGATPLHDTRADAVPVLLAAGLAVDVRDALDRTPLMTNETADTVSALLAAGARVDLVDRQQRSVLHFARLEEKTVEVLVAAGARLDVRDASGRTPLERARWNAGRTEAADDARDRAMLDALKASGDEAGAWWVEALETAVRRRRSR